ncbi:MAG: RNA polymerase sigma factor [Actinobacteria bacterium]|nr:MAG: RNA polymerase sigma factor [Actinomycetota bacterium]
MTPRAAIPPFQTFLEEHRSIVYRFLRASVGVERADDAFQETFLAALRAYPSLEDGRNLRGWVLTIATRKAIDAGRAGRRRALTVADVAAVGDANGQVGGEPEVFDAEDPVWKAVSSLPPRQRAAIVHRYVLDRSYAEVAAAMASTEEAARANVHQGLRKLKEVVRDEDE